MSRTFTEYKGGPTLPRKAHPILPLCVNCEGNPSSFVKFFLFKFHDGTGFLAPCETKTKNLRRRKKKSSSSTTIQTRLWYKVWSLCPHRPYHKVDAICKPRTLKLWDGIWSINLLNGWWILFCHIRDHFFFQIIQSLLNEWGELSTSYIWTGWGVHHINHFWHHPLASRDVIVWKVMGQHLILNIIHNNFTAKIEWKVWCDRGMSLTNYRLKFKTSGILLTILEGSTEYTSN